MDLSKYTNLDYDSMKDNISLCRDMEAGQTALRSAKYLPQFKGESLDGYRDRLNSTYLNNKFIDKINLSVGLILNKPIKSKEDTPDYIINDTNRSKENINIFAQQTLTNGEIDGHSFILVASPSTQAQNILEQERNNIHPYFVNIKASQLLNWAFDDSGSLSMVAIATVERERDGEFKEKNVDVVKVYRKIDNAVTLERIKEINGQEVSETVALNFKEIPLVPFYANKTGEMTSRPPFLSVANSNLNAFQLGSLRRRSLQIIADPDKAIFDDNLQAKLMAESDEDEAGVKEATLTFGADIAQVFGSEARYEYVEPTGRGVELVGEEIKKIEAEIDGMTAEIAEKTNMTATEAQIKNTRATASDVMFSENLEEALNKAFELLKQVDTSVPTDLEKPFTISRDFAKTQLSEGMITALNNAKLSGSLSQYEFTKALGSGKLPSFKTEEEIQEELDRLQTESFLEDGTL